MSEHLRTLPKGSQEVVKWGCGGGEDSNAKRQQAGSELTATQPHCTHHHGSPLRGTQTLGPYGRREIVPGHPRKESRITKAQPQLS